VYLLHVEKRQAYVGFHSINKQLSVSVVSVSHVGTSQNYYENKIGVEPDLLSRDMSVDETVFNVFICL
jgi:hypothetical protein